MRLSVVALCFTLCVLAVTGCSPGTSANSTELPDLLTATPFPLPGDADAQASATPVPATPTPEPRGISPEIAESLPDVTLDVNLHYYERWMEVSHVVEMVNTSPDSWSELVFSVPVNMTQGAFYLLSVKVEVDGQSGEIFPYFPSGTNILRIPLPAGAPPGVGITVEMTYQVIAQPLAKTDEPPVGLTGWTAEVLQAGEWYPALVPYIPGQGWMSWAYHPVGDPFSYALTNVAMTVRADEGIIVAGSGPQGRTEDGLPGLSPDGTWQFAVQGARGVAFFASDQYVLAEGLFEGIPVYSYYLQEHANAGLASLQIALESLEVFTDAYGDYPYQDLTIVENGFAGGMEYSALISISDFVYFTYPGQAPSVLHALTSHEVAHQWWYGAVGNDQVFEPWLDESLAFYAELIYLEHVYPDLVDWWWEVQVEQYNPSGPVDRSIYEFGHTSYYVVAVYGQAAKFLQALRDTMGDDAFFAFVKAYYETYRWHFVTDDDFFATLSQFTDADLALIRAEFFSETGS